jgi:hypothetical protein
MYIDVSMNIEDGMLHWPKDPEITIKQFSSIKNGDSANNSYISFGTHTGTHIDAPRHFVENGIGIDQVDLNTLIGVCRVIEISYDYKSITEKLLSGLGIKKGERIGGATIVDLAPTLMYLMKEDIPDDMDGVVLSDIFKKTEEKLEPVGYTSVSPDEDKDSSRAYSEEDRMKIQKRLQDLGYLS